MTDPDPAQPEPAPTAALVPSTLDKRVAAYSCNVLPADYTFDPALSVDDNYLVLTLIYARLSTSKRGNMACILVDPHGAEDVRVTNGETATALRNDGEPPAKRARASSPSSLPAEPSFLGYPGRILAHSNNTPQPHTVAATDAVGAMSAPKKKKDGQSAFLARASNFPELHAEARAVCLAARSGVRTAGATAYVSFPPCGACLPLLVAAGISRCVYRRSMSGAAAIELCAREGVECVEVDDDAHDEQLKAAVAKHWKARGEGRDETRTRLERWWKEQERQVMGAAVVDPVDGGSGADGAAAGEADGSAATAAVPAPAQDEALAA